MQQICAPSPLLAMAQQAGDCVSLSATPIAKRGTMPQQPRRIVILGAGPTGLGAAYRLLDSGFSGEAHVIERASEAGGLSRSIRDPQGFLWDLGGHVIFSHYEYFNRVMDAHVAQWNIKRRASHVWMGDRFVPYPLQHHVHHLPEPLQAACLQGLADRSTARGPGRDVSFEDWIATCFGQGLGDVFMRPYNRKVWTVDPREMSSGWVGERVAVPDAEAIRAACLQAAHGLQDDSQDGNWGPNTTFRYPARGGTGGIWKAVAASLPADWLRLNTTVTSIDLGQRRIHLQHANGDKQSIEYDAIINTMPLDQLLDLAGLPAVTRPVYSSTVVVGVGLRGQPPAHLANRCWMYFPQSDIPFYRLTVFSNYSDDHVPAPGSTWSVMCEIAHRPSEQVSAEAVVERTTDALAETLGWIERDNIVSKWHTQLQHGYPVPTLGRDDTIDPILHELEARHRILSRGRFGAWKYEVANQDHSFMQGVEAADHLVAGSEEPTVWFPNLVNGAFQTWKPTPR